MNKWSAQIQYKNQHFVLGHFDTPEAAAKAYNEKALELHGAFAQLNELPEGTEAIPSKPKVLHHHNTSGYRGVHRDTRSGKWFATLRINGKQVCVGRFATPLEAAIAYNEAAKLQHGEHARLNEL